LIGWSDLALERLAWPVRSVAIEREISLGTFLKWHYLCRRGVGRSTLFSIPERT
jgi:hypothetical protein